MKEFKIVEMILRCRELNLLSIKNQDHLHRRHIDLWKQSGRAAKVDTILAYIEREILFYTYMME